MVTLRKYTNKDFDALNYSLKEDQAKYTGDIDYCINKRKDLETKSKNIISILYNEEVTGFFILDIGEDKCKLTKNNQAVLIRSFSINPLFQGRGIGKKSMILVSDFIKNNLPEINEIVLSVNMKNKNAYQLYLKSFFIDEGKTINGIMGPQHILNKKI